MTRPSADQHPPAVLLMGPTAAGKTSLAIRLVEDFPFEIVSVDSAMVYRGLDIGTAKPEPELLARAPHRLINLLDPSEAYSAARFRRDALKEMHSITTAGRVPLLVGGTMLYFRALQHGLAAMPPADAACRRALDERAQRDGWPALHRELMRVDPAAGARIHQHDAQRIQRALEVFQLTGIPISDLQRPVSQPPPFRLLKIAIAEGNRERLHQNIEIRFKQMITNGFIEEVEALHRRGDLHPGKPAVRAVGYRQLWGALEGDYDLAEGERRAIVATRQLAKRQMTWLRAEADLHWAAPAATEPDGELCDKLMHWIA